MRLPLTTFADEDICMLVLKYGIPAVVLNAVSLHALQLISDDPVTRGNGRTGLRKYFLTHCKDRIAVDPIFGRTRKIGNREFVDTCISYPDNSTVYKSVRVSEILKLLE